MMNVSCSHVYLHERVCMCEGIDVLYLWCMVNTSCSHVLFGSLVHVCTQVFHCMHVWGSWHLCVFLRVHNASALFLQVYNDVYMCVYMYTSQVYSLCIKTTPLYTRTHNSHSSRSPLQQAQAQHTPPLLQQHAYALPIPSHACPEPRSAHSSHVCAILQKPWRLEVLTET